MQIFIENKNMTERQYVDESNKVAERTNDHLRIKCSSLMNFASLN